MSLVTDKTIIAHDVNNLGRLAEAIGTEHVNGIEVDIFVDNGNVIVGHDIETARENKFYLTELVRVLGLHREEIILQLDWKSHGVSNQSLAILTRALRNLPKKTKLLFSTDQGDVLEALQGIPGVDLCKTISTRRALLKQYGKNEEYSFCTIKKSLILSVKFTHFLKPLLVWTINSWEEADKLLKKPEVAGVIIELPRT